MTRRFIAIAFVLAVSRSFAVFAAQDDAGPAPRHPDAERSEAEGSQSRRSISGTIVVLPFDNLSGVEEAPAAVEALMMKSIASKGWTIAPTDQIAPLLEKERVRYLDSLEDSVRKTLLESIGADAVVSGTLYKFSSGQNPIVATSARMVRADGSLAWADIAGLSADDTEEVLGFGRKTTAADVAQRAVAALMRRFPTPAQQSVNLHGPSKPLFRSGPATFRSPDLDPSTPHLVCVLPFDNSSGVPDATRVVADAFSIRLAAANGFEVVEPANLRAAALKARIGSFRGIGSDDLARLATVIGTPMFLQGTIYRYNDGSGRTGTDPQVQLELSLTDVRAGRVVWTAQHDRKGTDYIGFLMLGAVSNGVSLTDRVVAEMIEAATRGRSRGAAAASRAAVARPEKHSRLRGPTKDGDKR